MTEEKNFKGFVYAGFWIRFLAFMIDSVLIAVVTSPVLLYIYGDDYLVSGGDIFASPLDFLISCVAPAVATILFWVYRQATPGKMAISGKIVDADTGKKLSTGQCIGRYFAYIPSVLFFGLGFLWVVFDKRKQGWHDKLAGTVVIRKKEAVAFKPRSTISADDKPKTPEPLDSVGSVSVSGEWKITCRLFRYWFPIKNQSPQCGYGRQAVGPGCVTAGRSRFLEWLRFFQKPPPGETGTKQSSGPGKTPFRTVFLHEIGCENLTVHGDIDPGIQQQRGGQSKASVEVRIAVCKPGGLHGAGKNNYFAVQGHQDFGSFHHCVGAVYDHTASGWFRPDLFQDTLTISVCHVQAVFSQHRTDIVIQIQPCLFENAFYLWRPDFVIAQRVVINFVKGSPGRENRELSKA